MIISRRTAGKGARYVIAAIFFVPAIFVAFGSWATDKLNTIFSNYCDRLMNTASRLNAIMTKWESNSPEGTMERLKK